MRWRLFFAAWVLMPFTAFASPVELIPILETLVKLNTKAAQSPEAPLTRIASGSTLKLGSSGQRVAQLNARLAELGFVTQGDRFDKDTDAAVRNY